MTEEETFLAAILAQPDDDTVRLVYADWLTEHGDADRGEFIRVEVELARTPPDSIGAERRRSYLFGRRAELLKRHRAAWLAPFAPYARESSFERGFVQALEVSASVFAEHAGRWAALTPLTRVKITTCREWDPGAGRNASYAARLFTSPHLSSLVELDLERAQLYPADLAPLARHPDLSRLRVLTVAWNPIGDAGAAVLANMPQLSGLEELDLRTNSIKVAGARALAASPHLGRLKELQLFRDSIDESTWELLRERFGGALVG
jgi:uncharacterized protein (TIGR02996 family)